MLRPAIFRDRSSTDRWVLLAVAVMVTISLMVAVFSRLGDAARNQIYQPALEIWLLELSSHLTILALAALFPAVLSRLPTTPGPARSLAFAALGFTAFAGLHISLTYLVREILFPPLFGRPYELNLADPGVWLYELPKDLLAYLVILVIFLAGTLIARPPPPAPETKARRPRIALRSGSTVRLVAATDIVHARSAGNYVEVFAPSQAILARMTLRDLERQLAEAGSDHVRVHRTCLVHLGHVTAVTPTGEGDVEVTLDTGVVVPGSRRYRDNLDRLTLKTGE
ncbi:LytTR family DNA-binding domain-containing protein [Hyphomonas sp.]|uniref:LytR/AlgR family response regulator transcription factor n=1 Tax=Hyphomonas sp. TaxID=87 RepID=UPI001D1EFE31|nr:LytTR family DNA-binding domain-containing protein [Hyphomonas sp.]MBU3920462.1 LytTR family transcriptional regulator [Alphaproteobacteria bacterium]MBU4060681.1 LytTR family transcriptional regulator [Alphaproteobacteria bacterium]MBU4164665.1 LytTR family transcriptional regulator [Alphaproteobacteria bacterium]